MRLILSTFFLIQGLTFSSVAKEPFKPNLGPDHKTITVNCGEVTLVLRQQSQWTPARFDWRGHAMTTEHSAYGTVFSFPGVGFIGTGHLENEPEPLKSLRFEMDGQEFAEPPAELQGNHFRFERQSAVRGFDLTCVTEVKNQAILETTTIHAREEQPLALVYHFMHAWKPTVSAYAAGTDSAPDDMMMDALTDAPEVKGKFYIARQMDWMAVYESESGQYAVSRLLNAPKEGGNIFWIWNQPGRYRKFYLKCFEKQTVPQGFTGTWKMVTAFGEAGKEEWIAKAKAKAAELKVWED